MAMRMKLDTKGMEETLEDLARQEMDVDAAASDALAAGGDVLLGEMEVRVPRKTGNLAKHLERTVPEQDGNYISTTVGISRRADKRTAIYGAAQEYGTSSMAAQPYIRPGVDAGIKKARAAMIERLRAWMGK